MTSLMKSFEDIKFLEHLSDFAILQNYLTHWSKPFSAQDTAHLRQADLDILYALQARGKNVNTQHLQLMSAEETQQLYLRRMNKRHNSDRSALE